MKIGDRNVLWFKWHPKYKHFQARFRRENEKDILILIDEGSVLPDKAGDPWIVEVTHVSETECYKLYKVKLVERVLTDIIFESDRHPRTGEKTWTRVLELSDEIAIKYVLRKEDYDIVADMGRAVSRSRWECKVSNTLFVKHDGKFFVLLVEIVDLIVDHKSKKSKLALAS